MERKRNATQTINMHLNLYVMIMLMSQVSEIYNVQITLFGSWRSSIDCHGRKLLKLLHFIQ